PSPPPWPTVPSRYSGQRSSPLSTYPQWLRTRHRPHPGRPPGERPARRWLRPLARRSRALSPRAGAHHNVTGTCGTIPSEFHGDARVLPTLLCACRGTAPTALRCETTWGFVL